MYYYYSCCLLCNTFYTILNSEHKETRDNPVKNHLLSTIK